MYIKVLVNQDVEYGQRLLDALKGKLPITAAFWLYFDEANEWRLVLVSPVVREQGSQYAYRLIRDTLAAVRIPIPVQNVSVLSPVSLRYKEVRLAAQDARPA